MFTNIDLFNTAFFDDPEVMYIGKYTIDCLGYVSIGQTVTLHLISKGHVARMEELVRILPPLRSYAPFFQAVSTGVAKKE